MNKVFPVERGEQESSGYFQIDEAMIDLALGIEVGHFVLAHERGHAVIKERHPLATVFQRRLDDVPYAFGFGGFGQGADLGQLLFGREILPEKDDAICPISTVYNAAEAGPRRRGRPGQLRPRSGPTPGPGPSWRDGSRCERQICQSCLGEWREQGFRLGH